MTTIEAQRTSASLPEERPGLEVLARRLLELLGRITGLESTYLTMVDWGKDLQHILYSLNTGDLVIPEGLQVEWSDTLCRRALDGGPTCTSDVLAIYPDSAAARELGITTYVTVPVEAPDGTVFGTVCGASSKGVAVTEEAQLVMRTLAQMIALQLAHDAALADLGAASRDLMIANAELEHLSHTDALTGLANRRSFEIELGRACSEARRCGADVSVLSLDVDRFKDVNDQLGHAAGDAVLVAIASHLQRQVRNGDVVARFGGDELLVLLRGTGHAQAMLLAERLRATATPALTDAGPVAWSVSVGVATTDGSDPHQLLAAADASLYEAKRAGRNQVR